MWQDEEIIECCRYLDVLFPDLPLKRKRVGEPSAMPMIVDDLWPLVAQFINPFDTHTLINFISVSKKHIQYAKVPLDRLLSSLLEAGEGLRIDHEYGDVSIVMHTLWDRLNADSESCKKEVMPLFQFFGDLQLISLNAESCSSFYEFLDRCKLHGFTTVTASVMLSILNLARLRVLLVNDGKMYHRSFSHSDNLYRVMEMTS